VEADHEEVLLFDGEPGGARTRDHRIKSVTVATSPALTGCNSADRDDQECTTEHGMSRLRCQSGVSQPTPELTSGTRPSANCPRTVEAYELDCHACGHAVSFPVAAVAENPGERPFRAFHDRARSRKHSS
jgi:hypothetical protein